MSGILPFRKDRRRQERRVSGGVAYSAPIVPAQTEAVTGGELQILNIGIFVSPNGIFVRTGLPESISQPLPVNTKSSSTRVASATDRGRHTVDEACEILHVKKSKLYVLMRDGEIVYAQPGRERLISAASIEAYLARSENNKGAVPRGRAARKLRTKAKRLGLLAASRPKPAKAVKAVGP